MKRLLFYASLILISTLVITFVFVRRSRAVPLNFNKKDLPHHGLVIVRQSDLEFENLRSRVPDNSIGDDKGQPQCFLKNLNSDKRVIAYTLKWEMMTEDGQVITRLRRASRNDLLAGKEGQLSLDDTTTLLPQTARFFSLFGYADGQQVDLKGTGPDRSARDNRELMKKINETGAITRVNEQLKRTVSVTLSIDSALFDDGTFVGEDTTSHYHRINAQADVKRNLVKELSSRLKSGEPYESVMKSIQERSSNLEAFVMTPAHDATAEEITKHYEKKFADEILEMQAGFQSDELALRQFIWVNHNNEYLKIRKSPE
jgi:hypothetical protein